jgi:hypothetical protein
LGTHEVLVSVTDGVNVVTCSTGVEVVDTTPPVIVGITATPNRLWPPNHRMVPVRVNVQASDACGPVACRITGVSSDQLVDGVGDGNTSPDWRMNDGLMVELRAERAGPIKRGRTYTVSVECSDMAGNTSSGVVTVFVPHDQGRGKPDKEVKPGGKKPKNKDGDVVTPPSKGNKKPKKNGKK